MYKFKCEKWYGYKEGLRNIHADDKIDENQITNIAKKDAEKFTGSENCEISLLQKFSVTVKPIKNYAALASIPFTVNTNESIKN